MVDIHQAVRMAMEKSGAPTIGVNGDAVSVCPFERRGKYRAHWSIREPTDAAKEFRDLGGLCLQLESIVRMLVGATTAIAKEGAGWRDAARG